MTEILNPILVIGSDKTESEIIIIICRDLGYDRYDKVTVEDIKNGNLKETNYLFAVISEKLFTDQLKEFIKILRRKQPGLPVIFFSKYSTLRIENTVRLPSITLTRNMSYALEKLKPKKKDRIDLKKINSAKLAVSQKDNDNADEARRLMNILDRVNQKQSDNVATILDLQRKIHLYDVFILIKNSTSQDSISLFFHEGYVFLVDYSKTTEEINEIYNWQDIIYKTININDQKDMLLLTKSKRGWRKSEFTWNASKYLKRDTIKALNIFPEGSFKISLIAPSFIIARYQVMIEHFSLTLVSSMEFTLESLRYRFPTHFDEILKIVTVLHFGNVLNITEVKPAMILDKRTKRNRDIEPTIKYKTVAIKKGFLSKIIDKIRGL